MSHTEAFLRRQHPRLSWKRFWYGVMGFCALALLVICWMAWMVWGHVVQVRGIVETFQEDIAVGDLEAAQETWKRLEPEFLWADSLGRVGLWADGVPLIGSQTASIRAMLLQGVEMARIAGDVLTMVGDIQSDVITAQAIKKETIWNWGAQTSTTRAALFSAFAQKASYFDELSVRLKEARERLEQIPASSLWDSVSALRHRFLEAILAAERTIDVSAPFISVLPELGGFDTPKHYLLILQNNTELRPTGGFWGTYGVLTVKDGLITEFLTDDVYVLDGPAMHGGAPRLTPPAPMEKYIGLQDGWLFRDANWSPDVPTSVREALAMYQRQTTLSKPSSPIIAPRVHFDGVVLVNPDVVVRALEVLGPVTIDDVTFDHRWFVEALEYQVEQAFVQKGLATTDRKDIIKPLGEELLRRAESASGEMFIRLMEAVTTSFAENDILLYSTRPTVQRLLESEGWAGDMRIHAVHDHFMVVDANLAALKTDHAIRRSYSYAIRKNQEGRFVGTLRIDYDHTASGFDYRTSRYRTYARIYVPEGSTLVNVMGALENDKLIRPDGAKGKADTMQEFGATVFGAFTSIEPGRKGSLVFEYILPERIGRLVDSGQYVLDVQRQPGVGRVPLAVHLDFDRTLSYAYPGEAPEYWYDDVYTISTTAQPFQQFTVGF